MKNGLYKEHGKLIYYKNGKPYHAGAIEVRGEIYYISKGGYAVTGEHDVHKEMTNGLLKSGTYDFGKDGKLIRDSYLAPERPYQRQMQYFWKKWSPVIGVALLLTIAIMLASYKGPKRNAETVAASMNAADEIFRGEGEVVLPQFEEKVLLCTTDAKRVYDGTLSLEKAIEAQEDLDYPYRHLAFEYDLPGEDGVLTVMEANNSSWIRSYELPAERKAVILENLKTDCRYLYEVVVEGKTYTGHFMTEKSTRFISVPGMVNMRDIGGYQTLDGKTVRQGVLIRGSEMDGLQDHKMYLNAENVEDVRETFGFVYDMDLRSAVVYDDYDEDYRHRLGDDVGHKFYGAPQLEEIFIAGYWPTLKDMFTDLADPEKYPMYLHCSSGIATTGTVVFLLQGVLNMSEEDMMREYGLSGFWSASSTNADTLDGVIEGLQAYRGETLQEKIVTFLKENVGVADEQLATIREIYLED